MLDHARCANGIFALTIGYKGSSRMCDGVKTIYCDYLKVVTLLRQGMKNMSRCPKRRNEQNA